MKIGFDLELSNRADGFKRIWVRREFDLPAVPRVGDDVVLTPGGWSEPVRLVWWDLPKGEIRVELGHRTFIEYDPAEEDLAAIARDAGWIVDSDDESANSSAAESSSADE